MVKDEAVEVDEGQIFSVLFPRIGHIDGEKVAVGGVKVFIFFRKEIACFQAVVAMEEDDGLDGFVLVRFYDFLYREQDFPVDAVHIFA